MIFFFKNIISTICFALLFLFGCSSNHFIIYKMNGEIEENRVSSWRSKSGIELYFDKQDIKYDYEEINIIATNNFYYGQFFFDDVFMDILETQAISINADALIYEKNKKNYPNYDDEYLYFTAIRYKNKGRGSAVIH